MTWCSVCRSPLGWLGNNCTGVQQPWQRTVFSHVKPSYWKTIHSQKVTWVKTLEVLLNFLALLGVLSSWMSGGMRERQISSSKPVGGITQLHITAGCKYYLSHYPNYAVAPKSAYPNTSERSYVSTLSSATWFWTETSKLIRASLPAVMWGQQPLAG